MPINIFIYVGLQLLATCFFCIVALFAVQSHRRLLQSEIPNVYNDHMPLETYQRYVVARARIIGSITRFNLRALLTIVFAVLTLLLALELAFTPDITFSEPLSLLSLAPPIIGALLAIFVGYYIGAHLHGVLVAIVVDAEALRVFGINDLRRSDITALKLRSVLLRLLPPVLFCEALMGTSLAGENFYYGFATLIFVVLFLLVLQQCIATRYYSWLARVQPIEQTDWAHLAPRIQGWAQLGGIQFSAILIQKDLIGTTNIRLLGMQRPTLVLSETLLRYSEWRQWDAAVAIGVGIARKRLNFIAFLRQALMYVIVITFLIILPISSNMSLGIFGVFPLFIVMYILIRVTRLLLQRYFRGTYFDVDRIATYLTGDPMAIMVALNTINRLLGTFGTGRTANVPSTYDRVLKLDALAREPWARAPHASALVPAISAVNVGPYQLTVPLNQATEMAPLPPQAYIALETV